MRILADENVDRPIVVWLREQGHDVSEAAAIAPGSNDANLVALSRGQRRILITFDRDIGRIVHAQNQPHPGVAYLRLRGGASETREMFMRLWPRIESEVPGHLITVRNDRIRRRPLPKETPE